MRILCWSGLANADRAEFRICYDDAATGVAAPGVVIAPRAMPPNDHLAIGINAMDLKHRLRNIEVDRLNCLHNWLL
jgi:hypothetical protein